MKPLHHTPVRALYDPHLIGYRCEHCGNIFTASMNFSEPEITRISGKFLHVRENKRHARRLKAAK